MIIYADFSPVLQMSLMLPDYLAMSAVFLKTIL